MATAALCCCCYCFIIVVLAVDTDAWVNVPSGIATRLQNQRRSYSFVSPKPCGTSRLSAYYDDTFFDDDEGKIEEPPEEEEEEISDEELEASAGEWDERIARVNAVQLTGRVGSDASPRYFDDGKVVVNISLAVKRKYHGLEWQAEEIKAGEEETDWYGLEIWVRAFPSWGEREALHAQE